MSKIASVVRARQQNYTSLQAVFRSENGAIDLASIMVGIIVIGLIGGVIAATVFAVIPWAQDNAAKQQLDSIHAAQNVSYGLSADPTVTPDQSKRNMFTNSQGLEIAGLLTTGTTYCVIPAAAGKNYTAYAKSASGKIWTASNSAKKATILSGTPEGACSTLGASTGGTLAPPVANGGVVTTYSASLLNATGVDITSDQTVYAAVGISHAIKKMTAGGTITTLAGGSGVGFADGQGVAAKFNNPQGIIFGPDGNLYVADTENHRIRMMTPAGLVSTIAGTGTVGGTDGNAASSTFNYPYDLAFDSTGNLYISETAGKKVRKITPAGIVSTVAVFTIAAISIDTDAAGNVYVLTTDDIRKISPTGGWNFFASGVLYRGLAIEQSTGIVYVTASGSIIEKILPDGTKTILAGTAGQYGNVNGTGAEARFSYPRLLELDSTGALIMSSSGTADATLRMIK